MGILLLILAVLLAFIFVEAGLSWPYDPGFEITADIAVGVIGIILTVVLIALR